MKIETRAVHAGRRIDPATGAVATPIHMSTTFERTADGALIKATIPRAEIVLAQTPQGFRYEVLQRAMDEAMRDGFTGTDEASLVERMGHPVAVVMGAPRNLKITTPADMDLAGYYLRGK